VLVELPRNTQLLPTLKKLQFNLKMTFQFYLDSETDE